MVNTRPSWMPSTSASPFFTVHESCCASRQGQVGRRPVEVLDKFMTVSSGKQTRGWAGWGLPKYTNSASRSERSYPVPTPSCATSLATSCRLRSISPRVSCRKPFQRFPCSCGTTHSHFAVEIRSQHLTNSLLSIVLHFHDPRCTTVIPRIFFCLESPCDSSAMPSLSRFYVVFVRLAFTGLWGKYTNLSFIAQVFGRET